MIRVKFLPTLPSLLAEPSVPLIHRDLSWLQFNDRVLAEARQASNPLCERVKFLSISASNLDEFFMIRFASLARSLAGAIRKEETQRIKRLTHIRSSILENVAKFGARQVEALDLLASELQAEKIRIVGESPEYNEKHPAFALGRALFEEAVLPKLDPPEGFTSAKLHQLENLQLAVLFPSQIWFKIPKSLPPVLWNQDPETGIIHAFFLDHLLAAHLGSAFRIVEMPGIIRLTRDGDFNLDLEEEDTESIPDAVRSSLGTREKGRPVRLQYSGNLSEDLLTQCGSILKLDQQQILPDPRTACLHGLWPFVRQLPQERQEKTGLFHPPLKSHVPKPFQKPETLFKALQERDYLLHHPYDSFDSYVAWIHAACADPDVAMIEQTVYRMDVLSPVIEALKSVARKKKVRVIIELRARFDELNNLALTEELRKAGVEVTFGFGKLKLHAKIALVTRNENGTHRLYTHLSTGNYNATTARQYTDLAILTANADIGQDARAFFDAVTQGKTPTQFQKLVPAPGKLHRRILTHIENEIKAAKAGQQARIVAKVNALVDEGVIESLYRASMAGIRVDLIVRGACSLVPGVKGLSENIRVISVVDRFLEHSRIYYFGSSKTIYLSSADWMQRNFFSRLEIAFPVLDPRIYSYLEQVIIPAYVADTAKARELTPQGTWKKRPVQFGKPQIRSQFFFAMLAENEYRDSLLQ